MASPYQDALLLRLRHIVEVRRDPEKWAELNDVDRILVKRSLWAALDDAEREGLGERIGDIITPEEAWRV